MADCSWPYYDCVADYYFVVFVATLGADTGLAAWACFNFCCCNQGRHRASLSSFTEGIALASRLTEQDWVPHGAASRRNSIKIATNYYGY